MTDPAIGQQFEELWGVSVSQARYRRGWHDMNLEEKKTCSSRFRRAMKKYSQERPDGVLMDAEVFVSPGSSTEAG